MSPCSSIKIQCWLVLYWAEWKPLTRPIVLHLTKLHVGNITGNQESTRRIKKCKKHRRKNSLHKNLVCVCVCVCRSVLRRHKECQARVPTVMHEKRSMDLTTVSSNAHFRMCTQPCHQVPIIVSLSDQLVHFSIGWLLTQSRRQNSAVPSAPRHAILVVEWDPPSSSYVNHVPNTAANLAKIHC